MNNILKTTLIGLFFGTFGTTIGGLIGVNLKSNSNKFLGFILSFASGLMMAIICFDLLPEAMEIASLAVILLGILLGILTMIICDTLVKEKFSNKKEMNSLLRTGIIISIGLALHNIPEGMAVGVTGALGFDYSLSSSMAIFTGLRSMAMSYSPKKGTYTEANFNGTSELNEANGWEYDDIHYEYVDQVNPGDNTSSSTATKLTKISLPFSNVGVNVGFKYSF